MSKSNSGNNEQKNASEEAEQYQFRKNSLTLSQKGLLGLKKQIM